MTKAIKRLRKPATAALQARQAIGATQKDFARLLGCNVATVKQWETGVPPHHCARTLLLLIITNPTGMAKLLERVHPAPVEIDPDL